MYCVYLTIYRGEKLPRWYIGMSSMEKVENGYRGSVSSKRYKTLWKSELATNDHLFETVIIHKDTTKEAALAYEHSLQVRLDVVKRSDFINLANAGGFGGIDTAIITEANKGFRVICVLSTGRFARIRASDFDPNLHINPTHSETTLKFISENTAKAMVGKIEDGTHWFLSDDFIQNGIDRRKGVPRTPSERLAVSEGRLKAFQRMWEIEQYRNYPWESICTVVEWYNINFVKHSQIFAKKSREFVASVGIGGTCAKWLLRKLGRESERPSLTAICQNYKETHEDKKH